MKHIRFVGTNIPVCKDPDSLGSDLVVIDYNRDDHESCMICLQLVQVYNKEAYEAGELLAVPQNPYDHIDNPEDPLGPARGILIGVCIGSIMWTIIFLLIWLVFVR